MIDNADVLTVPVGVTVTTLSSRISGDVSCSH